MKRREHRKKARQSRAFLLRVRGGKRAPAAGRNEANSGRAWRLAFLTRNASGKNSVDRP